MTVSKTLLLTLTALVMPASFAAPGGTTGATPAFTDAALSSGAGFSGGGVDALTESCLDCHDGTEARHITARPAGTPTPYDGHRSLDHPIGMRYRDYPARNPGSYRYLLNLDPSIQLIDGKVACVSCHRLKPEYAQQAHHVTAMLGSDRRDCTASEELARDARTDSLCLACHLM